MASSYGQSTDIHSLENMLYQFRVNELQMLLAAFKIAKLGKKNELLERARQLLHQQRPPNQAVINKIREIHTKRFVTMQHPQPQQSVHNRATLSTGLSQPSGSSHFLDPISFPNSHRYGGIQQQQQQYGTTGSAPATATNRARNLRMVELPFYEHLHTIIEPTELLVTHPGKNSQDMIMAFSVPEKFVSSVSYRSDSQPLPRIELQLRFFLLDLTSEQKDDFPPNCAARIDDQPVQLPNIIPTNKPNVEAKRPSRSVNITPYCQPPRYGLRHHRLHVSWTADKRVWAICLSVVRRLTSDILLKRLRNNQKMHRPMDETKRLIMRRLGGGDDGDDIAMDSLRVSLLCPLGKTRMTMPTKPAQCEHLQCFDATLFLMMNEKKPTWKCPVCDNPARYSDLVIDGYFEQVLNGMDKSVTEIELLLDGTWKAVQADDDDDSDSEYAAPTAPIAKTVSNSAFSTASSGMCGKASSAGDDDIIILDDSDDEPTNTARSNTCAAPAGRGPAATSSAAFPSSTQMNGRLRPSPCSPTQSEGGSSASDPSIICIDIGDSSSSPPSRPGTGEAHRGSSSSTSLPYMQRTVSYSPSTPGYESTMTPPVMPQPPSMITSSVMGAMGATSLGTGTRRPATSTVYGDTLVDRAPPFKRMALGDDGGPTSLQLPTVSMQHMSAGFGHNASTSAPVMLSTTGTNSFGQSAAATYQQHTYQQQQSNLDWLNNYQASVAGYPSSSSTNGFYSRHNGFDVTPSLSISSLTSYPSSNSFNSSALPDFVAAQTDQGLQMFLSSIGMPQPPSGNGVPFNHS